MSTGFMTPKPDSQLEDHSQRTFGEAMMAFKNQLQYLQLCKQYTSCILAGVYFGVA